MIRRKTIAAWLLAIVLLPVLAQAADVCPAWDPNTKADLAGYKINYGLAMRQLHGQRGCRQSHLRHNL